MKQKPDSQLLNSIFGRYPGVQAVYVFGSSASGRTRADSDLDLAVVPRHQQVRAKKLDILADLARVGLSDVDLVFLDTDGIVLKYEAVRLNQLVYQAHDFDRGAFYSLVVRKFSNTLDSTSSFRSLPTAVFGGFETLAVCSFSDSLG